MSMRLVAALLAVVLSCAASSVQAQNLVRFPAKGQIPAGYPPEYAAIIAAAEQEKTVVIYSNTDIDVAQILIDDFQSLYPKIGVEYQDMSGNDLNNRFLTEALIGRLTADIVWSSAMDLQFNLVNSGFAQAYASPEIPALPAWAVWKNEAFGTTYEPAGFVYNKRLLPTNEVPQTRAELTRLLQAQAGRFSRKLVTYNAEKSEIGYLLALQDAAQSDAFWDLASAIGRVDPQFEVTSNDMLRSIATGNATIGYNTLSSYAFRMSRTDAAIGYIFPKDYTLVLSRIMFIGKNAANPNAARLWVDYILSKRGQSVIAGPAALFSLRSDVEGEATAAGLRKLLGDGLKPIQIGPNLLEGLERGTREQFLQRWRQTAAGR